jgi:hypothetical protein
MQKYLTWLVVRVVILFTWTFDDVLGADLSENSIAEASKDTNDTLHFKVHDMRAFWRKVRCYI